MGTEASDRRGLGWSVEKKSPTVFDLRFDDFKGEGATRKVAWLLLTADHHWDHPLCDRKALGRLLAEAQRRNAAVCVLGDLYCAMQGFGDPRAAKHDLRPEHSSGNYLDRLVDTAAEWYGKYGSCLAVLGEGNHETAVQKRKETNLIDRLAAGLRQQGHPTLAAGYRFWVRCLFRRGEQRGSKTICCHHGSGGGGPVTHGVIDWSRYDRIYGGFDVMAAGHVHRSNYDHDVTTHLDNHGRECKRDKFFLRCGTYKDEQTGQAGGFAVERNHGARPCASWWLKTTFSFRREAFRIQPIPATDV